MSPAAFLFGSCACRLLARTFLDYLKSDVMTMMVRMVIMMVVVVMVTIFDDDDDDY